MKYGLPTGDTIHGILSYEPLSLMTTYTLDIASLAFFVYQLRYQVSSTLLSLYSRTLMEYNVDELDDKESKRLSLTIKARNLETSHSMDVSLRVHFVFTS